MTVIAWDGKTLAADRLCSNSESKFHHTKVFRVEGVDSPLLMSATGDVDSCAAMIEWMRGGMAKEMPECQKDDKRYALLITVTRGGILVYYQTPYGVHVEDRFMAWGSGKQYAIAAMHCGKSAREACEIASIYDINCGGGIDEVSL